MNNEEHLQTSPEKTKLEKQLGKEYTAILEACSIKELEVKMLEIAKHEQAIIDQKKEDQALEDARNNLRELGAPYREQLKGNKQRARLCSIILQEKGGSL